MAKKQKRNRRQRSLPTYDLQGRILTPEKSRRTKQIVICFIILGLLAGIIYIPQLFIKDSVESTDNNAEVTCDATAIQTYNKALRNNPTEDFDGDGITNSEEEMLGTDIWNIDTDGDGATDYCEEHITKTNPTKYDDTLLTTRQNQDELNGKNISSPYMIGNLILWASDYESKAYGSVVETAQGGYRFYNFNGYVQFPDAKGKYVYKVENGTHTLLKYREEEDVWYVESGDYVEVKDEAMQETILLSVFGKQKYLAPGKVAKVLAAVLPDKGIITAKTLMKEDIDPDVAEDVTADIKVPYYDKSAENRFTQNTNTLNDLSYVRNLVAEGSCVMMSLFNDEKGEYIGVVYGYTGAGNLLVADPQTAEPVGVLCVTEVAKNILDENGEFVSLTYFDFEGFGFSSANNDRISFFSATDSESFGDEADAAEGAAEGETDEGSAEPESGSESTAEEVEINTEG